MLVSVLKGLKKKQAALINLRMIVILNNCSKSEIPKTLTERLVTCHGEAPGLHLGRDTGPSRLFFFYFAPNLSVQISTYYLD